MRTIPLSDLDLNTLLQDRHFEIEFITRAYRVRQSHFIPARSHEGLEVWLIFLFHWTADPTL